jgi:hypothetical protein
MPHCRILEEEQPAWWIVEVGYGRLWVSSVRGTKVKKKGERRPYESGCPMPGSHGRCGIEETLYRLTTLRVAPPQPCGKVHASQPPLDVK